MVESRAKSVERLQDKQAAAKGFSAADAVEESGFESGSIGHAALAVEVHQVERAKTALLLFGEMRKATFSRAKCAGFNHEAGGRRLALQPTSKLGEIAHRNAFALAVSESVRAFWSDLLRWVGAKVKTVARMFQERWSDRLCLPVPFVVRAPRGTWRRGRRENQKLVTIVLVVKARKEVAWRTIAAGGVPFAVKMREGIPSPLVPIVNVVDAAKRGHFVIEEDAGKVAHSSTDSFSA